MHCLTHRESVAWCRKHNYPVKEAGYYGYPIPDARDRFALVQLDYPTDSGKKIALAREVIGWYTKNHQLMLWISEWGVWPSSEHMPLFTRFRQALGEMRPLIEAPGHLINAGEFDEALSVLAVSLLFFWDCYVFSEWSGPVFFCSHDEWLGFFIPRGHDQAAIRGTFSNWLQ